MSSEQSLTFSFNFARDSRTSAPQRVVESIMYSIIALAARFLTALLYQLLGPERSLRSKL
jgi:hypothetical protein